MGQADAGGQFISAVHWRRHTDAAQDHAAQLWLQRVHPALLRSAGHRHGELRHRVTEDVRVHPEEHHASSARAAHAGDTASLGEWLAWWVT